MGGERHAGAFVRPLLPLRGVDGNQSFLRDFDLGMGWTQDFVLGYFRSFLRDFFRLLRVFLAGIRFLMQGKAGPSDVASLRSISLRMTGLFKWFSTCAMRPRRMGPPAVALRFGSG